MQTLQELRSGVLKGAKKLKLSCGLTEFPEEIFSLSETLEYLDLSGNSLQSLPENFLELKQLKILFLSDNDFTTFPVVLGKCSKLDIVGFKANRISVVPENALATSLRWLILTNNCITKIPDAIGNCGSMQKLMLAGNALKNLPEQMRALHNLELLRISANLFEEIPVWLFSLPRLAWLAVAGNPCTRTGTLKYTLPEINWQHIEINALLGEGASGKIYKALWHNNEQGKHEVAVKVFKGEVTSDGLPEDEMKACMAAGAHPNLVKVLGKIALHPEQRHGLVLELIPPEFTNLGGPPDFKSCTRDTFPKGTKFSLAAVVKIAAGIASAGAHLHAKGIMHGDLYAHNILIDPKAHALFGDFGAGSLINLSEKEEAEKYEKIEVRAYGCLLDDLLLHIDLETNASAECQLLLKVKEECLNSDPLARPSFSEVIKQLASF